MKLMMKGNKQLRVQDDRAGELEGLGYKEIDPDTGEYLEKYESEDKRKDSAVKKENAELKKQVTALIAQVEELTAKLAAVTPEPEK